MTTRQLLLLLLQEVRVRVVVLYSSYRMLMVLLFLVSFQSVTFVDGMKVRQPWSVKPWCHSVIDPQWPFGKQQQQQQEEAQMLNDISTLH